ncbi:MAG: hypothetical protein LBE25_11540 [Arthrobacter sp.]|jgi:hypothetical protein|nr:hypothetical protein [Arthrobacter sp.]
MGITAEELLAGPRGRLLCLNLVLAWEEGAARAAGGAATPDSAAVALAFGSACAAQLPLSDAVWAAEAALDPDPRGATFGMPYPEDRSWMTPAQLKAVEAKARAAHQAARRDPRPLIAQAADACRRITPRVPQPGTVLSALAETAGATRGWQPPSGVDVLLAQPEMIAALLPVAQAVATSPAAAWWSREVDPEDQWIERQDSDGSEWRWRLRGNIHDVWTEWARHRAEEEAEGFSSTWWTSPITFGEDCPPITHGTLPAAACDAPDAPTNAPYDDEPLAVPGTPTGFLIQEDSGPVGPLMQAGRLLPQAAPRVLEVASERDWVRLCAAFPLDVSRSYGPHARLALYLGDEPRATSWVIPDWRRVAREYDAVHLTVGAYLACATRPIEVPGHGCSAITGWDPDETYWLGFPPEQEPPNEANGRLRTWSEAGSDEWHEITRGPANARR